MILCNRVNNLPSSLKPKVLLHFLSDGVSTFAMKGLGSVDSDGFDFDKEVIGKELKVEKGLLEVAVDQQTYYRQVHPCRK
jgi:hypothetical protein